MHLLDAITPYRRTIIAVAVIIFSLGVLFSPATSVAQLGNGNPKVIAFLEAIAEADLQAEARQAQNTPVTPATEFHGLPGNNPGHSDEAYGAAPAGTCENCDGGMHNIAGVQGNGTGQPNDEPPACTAHGGLGAANPNCDD